MKELKIINKDYCAIIDDEDFERLNKFKWYANKNKSIKRSYWKPSIWGRGKTVDVSLAEEVMQNIGRLYDHKDRNSLNNQKDNLRLCTYKQNCYNTTKRIGTSSKYKGVCFSKTKRINPWLASIAKNNISYHIGYFDNEIEAAQAYNNKAKELFGEFAVLNIINYDIIQASNTCVQSA